MLRVSDPDRFQKISSGVQSIVVTVAVLVGGAWTLFAFHAQLQVENAKAQLMKLQREIAGEANVELSLSAHPLPAQTRNTLYIAGNLAFINRGSHVTAIAIKEDSLQVRRVIVQDGLVSYGQAVNVQVDPGHIPFRTTSISLFPGVEKRASFIVNVAETGVYVISFQALKPTSEVERLSREGANPAEGPQVFHVSTFVSVAPPAS